MFLALAILAFVVLRDPAHEVRPRTVDVARASPAAAGAALAELVAAIEDGDVSALSDLAPESDDASAKLLGSVGDNAGRLALRDVTARYIDQVGTVAADESWTGVVEMTWRFGGFDPSPARAEVLVSFAPDGDRLGITGFGADSTSARGRTPLWLRGPLAVVSTTEALVLAEGNRSDAEEVARRVTRGIDVVHRVLLDWKPRVVVEVPASAAALNRSLGVAPGTYDSIAAVTATADGSTRRSAPVHVYVNPEITASLRRAGAQVVMSHELVHVAMDAATSPVEPWLLEGFADYVAMRDVRLPDTITLGRAIEVVQRDGLPDQLPGSAEFDVRGKDLQAVYEQAWLACRIVAEWVGESGLVSFYRGAAQGTSMDQALRKAGVVPREVIEAWRGRLQDLAV